MDIKIKITIRFTPREQVRAWELIEDLRDLGAIVEPNVTAAIYGSVAPEELHFNFSADETLEKAIVLIKRWQKQRSVNG